MILDIDRTYNKIEEDIIINQKDIFNMYNWYTRKWSYLSDRLNNVNVGLFLNDNNKPTVQIYIKNKQGYIKSHLVFNKEGNKIINSEILNYKGNE